MIRLIFRLIGLIIIGGILFLALSLWQGGKPFRWFGQKTEQAGEIIKEKSKKLGDEADKLKETTDSMKKTSNKIREGIRKTGDKIKDVAGSKDEK